MEVSSAVFVEDDVDELFSVVMPIVILNV